MTVRDQCSQRLGKGGVNRPTGGAPCFGWREACTLLFPARIPMRMTLVEVQQPMRAATTEVLTLALWSIRAALPGGVITNRQLTALAKS
jgi:hypothetical protein